MILQAKRITVLQSLTDNICPLSLHWCYCSWITRVVVWSHSLWIKLGQRCPDVISMLQNFICVRLGTSPCSPGNPKVPSMSSLRIWGQWFALCLKPLESKCLIHVSFPREWDHLLCFSREAPDPTPLSRDATFNGPEAISLWGRLQLIPSCQLLYC